MAVVVHVFHKALPGGHATVELPGNPAGKRGDIAERAIGQAFYDAKVRRPKTPAHACVIHR
jgi:hypothetical protein